MSMCKVINEWIHRVYIVPRQWALANQNTEIQSNQNTEILKPLSLSTGVSGYFLSVKFATSLLASLAGG